jgi:hypothetical protein
VVRRPKGIVSTGHRLIARKYPSRDPKQILLDLAKFGDRGRWFAAAKDARFLDLALYFAQTRSTDPRTLSRASRDLLEKDAKFSLQVGRLAIERMLDGHGYDLTAINVADAYGHLMMAAEKLGLVYAARDDVFSMATNAHGTVCLSPAFFFVNVRRSHYCERSFLRLRKMSLTARETSVSDNHGDGVLVIRTYVWISLAVIPGGLVLWGWWYQHRRAWSTHKQDESMRRHVNRNYD